MVIPTLLSKWVLRGSVRPTTMRHVLVNQLARYVHRPHFTFFPNVSAVFFVVQGRSLQHRKSSVSTLIYPLTPSVRLIVSLISMK